MTLLNAYLVVHLIIGIVSAEWCARRAIGQSFTALAYVLTVTLWPVFAGVSALLLLLGMSLSLYQRLTKH